MRGVGERVCIRWFQEETAVAIGGTSGVGRRGQSQKGRRGEGRDWGQQLESLVLRAEKSAVGTAARVAGAIGRCRHPSGFFFAALHGFFHGSAAAERLSGCVGGAL